MLCVFEISARMAFVQIFFVSPFTWDEALLEPKAMLAGASAGWI